MRNQFNSALQNESIDRSSKQKKFCRFKKSGIKLVYVGIESGDTDVLLDSKRTTIAFDEQIYKVKKLEENNVKVKSMYILGQPTDTLKTCLKTINYSKKILKVCNKPISFEVFGDDYNSIRRQALIIKSWGTNVYVKIPVVNSKGVFMGKIIKELNSRNIKLNITAVYNAYQTKKILKCLNKKSKVIISIFAGRAADTGKDPIPEFKKSISISKAFKNVEILWASVREPYNYTQAKQIGCHIITVPPKIMELFE